MTTAAVGPNLAALELRARAALRAGPPMERSWADKVMADAGLDGLIVTQPINLFHMTGYRSARGLMGYPPESFGILSRHRITPALVTAQILYYYCFADQGAAYPLDTFLYTAPIGPSADNMDFSVEPPAASAPLTFRNLGLGAQYAGEPDRLRILDDALTRRPSSATAGRALMEAIRDNGLDMGRVGYDDPIIAEFFKHAGYPATLVPAQNILRRTRLVKSAREIELMRHATQANALAAAAAMGRVGLGATYADVRRLFFAEAAMRGNSGVFMVVDTVSDTNFAGEIISGSTFSIDAVSQGNGYHGDFARTVFVGDPPKSAYRAACASADTWDYVRDRLRPGVSYAEIKEIGDEASRLGGTGFRIGLKPHSVGLMHTDEPSRYDGGFFEKDNIVLEAGMIISVDCPVIDTGYGGSAHCEDLVLITDDGVERLHDDVSRFLTAAV